jgi:hypothetical protein
VLEHCFESGEKFLLVEAHAKFEHQSNL